MSEVADANIKRYRLERYPSISDRDRGRFCLLSVMGYESDDPKVNQKRDDLLSTLVGEYPTSVQTMECTIGNCDVSVTTDIKKGHVERTGSCTAATYCIKKSFDAVGDADTTEEGSARYREIMDTCEGFASKYSAGNFCPKLDCGLSAGVSIDMVPGTAGKCIVEIRSSQAQLFDPSVA